MSLCGFGCTFATQLILPLTEISIFTGMKHGVSKRLIYCSKCTKTHLQASVNQKNFFRLAIARHEGRGTKGKGRDGEEGRGGEGMGTGRREGNGEEGGDGEERRGGPPQYSSQVGAYADGASSLMRQLGLRCRNVDQRNGQ
jgi:hypothetical protein